jgi:hypothetical protein
MSIRYRRLKRIAIANRRFLKSAAVAASSGATAKEAAPPHDRVALRKGGGLGEDSAAMPVIPRQDILAKFRDMVIAKAPQAPFLRL